MTTSAFCPGHITALFYAPSPGPDVLSTGSRGAGVCIELGARATVTATRAEGTSVVAGPETRLAPVVATALGEYLSSTVEPVHLTLGLDLELPVGQGFGMSGAMCLAALMAAEGELNLVEGDVYRLLPFAHRAEVTFSTGLGDVVAQADGGLDLRARQGLPPSGDVLTRHQEGEVLVAWSGKPLHTRSVLGDPDAMARLESACIPLLAEVGNGPDLNWLLSAGWAFSQKAGLISEDVRRMVESCSPYGPTSQVMLGNSIFAVGDLDSMSINLEQSGFEFRMTSVDNLGVRLVG